MCALISGILFFFLNSDQQDVAEKNFVQLTYTDAVELLLRANKKFEFPVPSTFCSFASFSNVHFFMFVYNALIFKLEIHVFYAFKVLILIIIHVLLKFAIARVHDIHYGPKSYKLKFLGVVQHDITTSLTGNHMFEPHYIFISSIY